MNSRPRQACYPRGNFSDISNPHQRGSGCSLSQTFASGSLALEDPVRPAFAFALCGGFLSRLSRPLGPLDIFSRGCRPSQTAHQPLSQRRSAGKRHGYERAVFHGCLPQSPERLGYSGSRLRSASAAISQRQAAVKLHGVFFSRWELVDCSSTLRGFTGYQAGTVGFSLIHSCASELTRQGIWLP